MSKKVSKTYYIRGTITVRVVCVEGGESKVTSKVGVVPCAGFLTPDKPQKAIAFPVHDTETKAKNDSAQVDTAKLIDLNEKTCEFDAKIIAIYIPALLFLAGQQKPIELRLSVDEKGNWEIVGFVYPAP